MAAISLLSACTVSVCYRGVCVVMQRSATDLASLAGVTDPSSVDFSTFILKPKLVSSGTRIYPPTTATLSAKISYTSGASETTDFPLNYSSADGGYILADVPSFNSWYAASYSNKSTITSVDSTIEGLESSGIQTVVFENGKDVLATLNVN